MKTGEVKQWTGKELAEDLARHLQEAGWMVWTQIPLGSVQHSSPQIADVLAIPKSFVHPTVMIYEIKVSRADFFGDIARAKYIGYFKSANQVLFAVPSSLVKATELPQDGVGLIVRNETTWHVVKAGKRQDFRPGEELLLKLLMRGYHDHYQEYRSKKRRDEGAKEYTTLSKAFHDYGVQVAKDIARGSEILHASDEFLKEISAIMGKKYDNVSGAVRDLKWDVERLMNQKKHQRLALPMAEYATRLFNGDIYTDPVEQIEKLLEQARRDFPKKDDTLTK
jgi:hypothetical protein